MNKVAFYEGYLRKQAGATEDILKNVIKYPAILGAPIIAGYGGGRAYADIKEPTNQEVAKIQAAYVKMKLEQAIADLERKRKVERLRERFGGSSSTLRI